MYLARQAYTEGSQSLYESYRDATTQPHGYLVLDFAQDRRQTKVSNQCLSGQGPLTVYAPINDEAHKVELP
jgi:hypothetical protein